MNNNIIHDNITGFYNETGMNRTQIDNKLDTLSENISVFLKEYNIKPWLLITTGLVLNAFALLNLLRGEFYVFIGLYVFSQYTELLNRYYVNKYDLHSNLELYYSRISEWIKLITTILFFIQLYRHKIDRLTVKLLLFLGICMFILCNINFTVRNSLLIKENKEINKYIELWVKPMSNVSKERLEKIHSNTKYFTENLLIIYIVILMVIIHHI